MKTLVRLPPTAVSAVTITTAIRAAIRPYSIAVAPSSFFIKFVNLVNILNSPMWLFGNNTKEKLQNTYPEIARLSPGGLLVSPTLQTSRSSGSADQAQRLEIASNAPPR